MTETTIDINNAFTRLLQDFRDGESLSELSEVMQKCVAAARETGKSATLKYEITFSPQGNGIVVTDKVNEKIPQPDREGGIFFADENNNLTKDNPNQKKLDLREVVIQKPEELKEAKSITA